MRNFSKEFFFIILFFMSFSVSAKAGHQPCHCKLNKFSGGIYTLCFDYSNQVNLNFHKVVLTGGDFGDCKAACRNWVSINHSFVQSQVCSSSGLSNTEIRVMSDIKNLPAQMAGWGEKQFIDIMKCNLPWWSNTSNIPGGITDDGKCKREHIMVTMNPAISTPPPNGTPIGTWGFYWGNALVEFGTQVNGGAAIPSGQQKCIFKFN